MTDSNAQTRRRPHLLLEIAFVLACKLLFIFCLWYLFFSPEHRTAVTPERMNDQFFSSTAAQATPPTPSDRH